MRASTSFGLMDRLSEVRSGRSWRMVLGDCLDETTRDAAIPSRCDHVITDPPYSKAVHARSIRRTYLPDVADRPGRKLRAHEFGFGHLDAATRRAFAAFAALSVRRWVLVFQDLESEWKMRLSLAAAGLDVVRTGVWVKDRAMPQISGDRPGSRVEAITIAHPRGRKRWNGGGRGNVWQCAVVANSNGHRSDRVHTAQKPIGLTIEIIEQFTDVGDLIFDPFAGSATTGVAAIRLGRRFAGIERDPKFFEIACERLAAEEAGSTLQDARAGQVPMFGGGAP